MQLVIALSFLPVLILSCEPKPTEPIQESDDYPEYHAPANMPPVALFTVTPDSGTLETVFQVDASASSDSDGPDDYLKYSWNWYHDLYPYYQFIRNSDDPTASYQFTIDGLHTIQLTVTDPGRQSATAERDVYISGRTRWTRTLGGQTGVEKNVSSAAVDDNGVIYIGGSDGVLYAINSEGDVLWGYQTGDQINSSPSIGDDGSIYFGSYDGFVYALSPGGSLLWKHDTGELIKGSTAISAEGDVYIVTREGELLALEAESGSLRWSYAIDTAYTLIWSIPSIAPDGTIYTGNARGALYALYPDGTLRWKADIGWGNVSSPAIGADGTIYVRSKNQPHGDILLAVSPDGVLLWDYPMATSLHSSLQSAPAIGQDGTIYVGSQDGNVYAILPNGSLQWTCYTHGYVTSSPLVGDEGTIYVGSDFKYLQAINSDGTVKWQYERPSGFHASPALANGTLYIQSDEGILYALDVSSLWPADSPWPKFRGNARNTGRR